MLTKTDDQVMLTQTSYDVSKKLVQIYIPATSSLYFGLAAIWGLPASEEIVGTLAVLATFLGLILNVSSTRYENSGAKYDGQMVVSNIEDGKKLFTLQLDDSPEDLLGKNSITFRVCEENHTEG